MKPTYRDICYAIADNSTYSTDMLRIADSIKRMVDDMFPSEIRSPDGKAVWNNGTWTFPQDTLIKAALESSVVMQEVAYGRKIQAIKELRNLTGCGLKAAKDAIESTAIWQPDPEAVAHYQDSLKDASDSINTLLSGDPWAPPTQTENPPF